MIKKLIILALIIWGLFVFYKKFMAGTMDPFFKKHTGNVDVLQQKIPDYSGGVK